MRKILPPCVSGPLSVVSLMMIPVSASAANFTRCELTATEPDCIPGSGNATNLVNGATINIEKASGANDVVAFNWSVKNCFPKSGQLRGQVMVVVDNSKSEITTDVYNYRASVVKDFLTNFANRAATSGPAPGTDSHPKIGLMNYNGRSGVEYSDQKVDDLNARFDPDYCVKTTDSFTSTTPTSRWGTPSDANKISICEYLPISDASNTAAVSNMRSFVDFATAMPRGSTDFTYFFKGTAKAYAETTNNDKVGRNVVVVTDGLPNVPKYVAASTCRSTQRLTVESIVTGVRFGNSVDYCVDRQAPTAIAQAHTEALTSPFGEVNVHHVLFTENQVAYFDYDNDGKATLNPAGFLIENSARTGNGKVKFSYARGQSQLNTKLNELFDQFDKNALQYVKVEVTPQGGSTLSYKAVSPAAPGSTFDIKFVGLKTGNNTVKVTPVYQDGRDGNFSTFTVVVGGPASNGVKCSPVDEGKTVDGDLIGSKDPKGDGFYATPTSTGQTRDYRNSDESNRLANEFGIVGDSDSQEDYSNLRLQGGTGNCGVIAGQGGAHHSQEIIKLLALLLCPSLLIAIFARRFASRSEKRRS